MNDRGCPYTLIGFPGTHADDAAIAAQRGGWRPTVSLFSHDDLPISEFILLQTPSNRHMAEGMVADIQASSPTLRIQREDLDIADPWDFEQVYTALHAFALAQHFSPDRRYLIHTSTGTHVQQICLFLLAESRHLPASVIQSQPPSASKDGSGWRIIDLDLNRYDRLAALREQSRFNAAQMLRDGIATANPVYNGLIDRIAQVAVRGSEPVLLMGSTGTGKTQLARRIHALRRTQGGITGAFAEVDCAAVRGDLAQSALFGHVKGAFTGALRDRPGVLSQANKGTLFLDEIGELGLEEQTLLLKALDDGTFTPLGSDRSQCSTFLLIAGTNRDLDSEAAAGRFRRDLLARLDTWVFRLPNLRQRTEDIAPNIHYELNRWRQCSGRNVRFHPQAEHRYQAFASGPEGAWPGNFRDLRASITRLATLADDGVISLIQVDEEITQLRRRWQRSSECSKANSAQGEAQSARIEANDDPLDGLPVGELDEIDRIVLQHVVRTYRASGSLAATGRQIYAVSRRELANPNDSDRVRKLLLRFGLRLDQL